MNRLNMNYFKILPALVAAMLLLAACGDSKKESSASLNEKKAELAKLKAESEKTDARIAELEDEIGKLDTSAAAMNAKGKLVSLDTINTGNFSHYIELQGRIDAENISYVTPRGGPGQITAIYVQKGQRVSRGQRILKLDDRIVRQQMEQLKTQLSFAQDLERRRADLWKQGIGSEVELLSARNNVTQIERQMATLREQWNMTTVTAEVSGVVDDVMVKVGEIFQGGPQIRIVNTSSLKVITEVPENYLSSVGKGSRVEVSVPDINQKFTSTISFVGASINPNSRGFTTEAKLPSNGQLRPNQIAVVRILDYAAPSAIVVPVNIVQTDEKGKYVYIAATENNVMIARKRAVAVGQLQGDIIEVKTGLTSGDRIITEGYQGLYDGQRIEITKP